MADQDMQHEQNPEGENFGSRPASGARQALPSEIYGEEWGGNDGSADFLGLGADVDQDDWQPIDPNEEPMHVEEAYPETGAGLEMAEPVADYGAGDAGGYVEPSAPGAYAAPGGYDESGVIHGSWESQEELELDDYSEEELAAAPAGGGSFLKLAGLGLVAAVCAGGLVAVDYFGIVPLGLIPKSEEVAQVDPPALSAPSKQAPDADAPASGDTGEDLVAKAGVAENGGDPDSSDPGATKGAGGVDPQDPLAGTTTANPFGTLEDLEPQGPDAPEGLAQAETARPKAGSGMSQRRDTLVDPSVLAPMGASENDLREIAPSEIARIDVVWRGEEVPENMIHSGAKMLTPSVGGVRVLTLSGDVFQGVLKAVGQKRVWLGTTLGEIALDGDSVELIERVPVTAVPVGEAFLTTASPGNRVKATTHGGAFYGRVQSQHGDRLTLVLDSGARITLHEALVEPITERSRVKFKSL